MKIASIDIGTNTILLLIVEITRDESFTVLHDEQEIARLGKGVDADKIINRDTFLKAVNILTKFKKTSEQFSVTKIIATGTSALRDARNSSDFCQFVSDKTGIHIEVLPGDSEAHWTYRGALVGIGVHAEQYFVIDIGGGSTELITGNDTAIFSKQSNDVGSVRITERILKISPPDESSIQEAQHFLRRSFNTTLMPHISTAMPIGVAGTVTTLASIQQNLSKYDPMKVQGYLLEYGQVKKIFNNLKHKNIEQIRSVPQIASGRSDIILAGIMILMAVMETYQLASITVSDYGLRYGIALREQERTSIGTSH